jgi:hypothetical protein
MNGMFDASARRSHRHPSSGGGVMTSRNEVRFGVSFVLSLMLSWTLTTVLIGMAIWSGPQTIEHATNWAGVWVFTIGAPTLQALQIHRRLNDVLLECPSTPPAVRRDLSHARFVILMCGSMTVLLMFGLLVTNN